MTRIALSPPQFAHLATLTTNANNGHAQSERELVALRAQWFPEGMDPEGADVLVIPVRGEACPDGVVDMRPVAWRRR